MQERFQIYGIEAAVAARRAEYPNPSCIRPPAKRCRINPKQLRGRTQAQPAGPSLTDRLDIRHNPMEFLGKL